MTPLTGTDLVSILYGSMIEGAEVRLRRAPGLLFVVLTWPVPEDLPGDSRNFQLVRSMPEDDLAKLQDPVLTVQRILQGMIVEVNGIIVALRDTLQERGEVA